MTTTPPLHPGEILMQGFLEPLHVNQTGSPVAIRVAPHRINEIVHGKRRVTADTALRLAQYFGTGDIFWLSLQTRFVLAVEKDHLGKALERIPCQRRVNSDPPVPSNSPGARGMLLWMSSQVMTRLRPFLEGHCLPALVGVNVVHARWVARAPH